jgi:hypothetical protein
MSREGIIHHRERLYPSLSFMFDAKRVVSPRKALDKLINCKTACLLYDDVRWTSIS